MNVSMRNTVRNGEELFELIQMGLNSHLSVMSITNAHDVAEFLHPDLEQYQVPEKNYYQIESTKVLPGIFLWVTYGNIPKKMPIIGYNFNAKALHIALENSLMKMEGKYLPSHQAIKMIKNAGGLVFLANSNMHPLPSIETIDEIFSYHKECHTPIDGVEVIAPNMSKDNTILYTSYAQANRLLITGGDNYRYGEPKNGFAKIQLPENYESNWLLHL